MPAFDVVGVKTYVVPEPLPIVVGVHEVPFFVHEPVIVLPVASFTSLKVGLEDVFVVTSVIDVIL